MNRRWRLTRRGELLVTVVCTVVAFGLVDVLAWLLPGGRP